MEWDPKRDFSQARRLGTLTASNARAAPPPLVLPAHIRALSLPRLCPYSSAAAFAGGFGIGLRNDGTERTARMVEIKLRTLTPSNELTTRSDSWNCMAAGCTTPSRMAKCPWYPPTNPYDGTAPADVPDRKKMPASATRKSGLSCGSTKQPSAMGPPGST